MAVNKSRVISRLKSLTKVVSKSFNIKINISQDSSKTDCEKMVTLCDPDYYISLGVTDEDDIVTMALYSAIHESAHVLYTDKYDGVSKPNEAFKYAIGKLKGAKYDQVFALLNILEDFRIIRQLAFTRKGVVSFENKTSKAIKKWKDESYKDRAEIGVEDTLLYLLLCNGETKDIDHLVSRTRLVNIVKMVKDVREKLSKPDTTSLSSAELVVKYFPKLFKIPKPKKKPPEPPKPKPLPSTNEGETENERETISGQPTLSKDEGNEEGDEETENETKNKTENDNVEDEDEDSDGIGTKKKGGSGVGYSDDDDIEKFLRSKDEGDHTSSLLDSVTNQKTQRDYGKKLRANGDYDKFKPICGMKYGDYDKNGENYCKDHIKSDLLYIPSVYMPVNSDLSRIGRGNGDKAYYKSNTIDPILRSSEYRRSHMEVKSKLTKLLDFELDDYTSNKSYGSINPSSLYKYNTDNRVFRTRSDASTGGIFMYILLDASGSMFRTGQRIALATASIMHDVLKTNGIQFKIVSFDSHSMRYERIERSSKYSNECHINTNRMIEVSNGKDLDLTQYWSRSYNRDGLAIRLAYKDLMRQDADNKLLVVVSDGQPSDSGYDYRSGVKDTSNAISEARRDVNVSGIFIDGNSFTDNFRHRGDESTYVPSGASQVVKTIYGNDYTIVRTVEGLGKSIINALSRTLSKIQ